MDDLRATCDRRSLIDLIKRVGKCHHRISLVGEEKLRKIKEYLSRTECGDDLILLEIDIETAFDKADLRFFQKGFARAFWVFVEIGRRFAKRLLDKVGRGKLRFTDRQRQRSKIGVWRDGIE